MAVRRIRRSVMPEICLKAMGNFLIIGRLILIFEIRGIREINPESMMKIQNPEPVSVFDNGK